MIVVIEIFQQQTSIVSTENNYCSLSTSDEDLEYFSRIPNNLADVLKSP